MADEQLVVLLEARVSEFEKRMRKAENTGTRSYRGLERGSARATRSMETDMLRSTSRVNQALATTSASIGTLGRAFAGGLVAGGLAAVTTGLVRGVRAAAASVAQLGDEARRAGVSISAFQELKFVAEQNRIGIDQMVDGLKELSLRADEFIVTGKGPAAEAFARLGYSASELSTALEEPDELMLQIIGRLGDLDKAAQIRIADEVFGGSAGERFVELIDQGEASLRRTVDRAHEVGAVMDDELIAKAQELDRRFAEIEARLGNSFKAAVVGIADIITGYNENLDMTLAKLEAIDAVDLGSISLDGPPENLDAAAEQAEALAAAYESLANDAAAMAGELQRAGFEAGNAGLTEAGLEIYEMGSGLERLVGAWRANTIDAETFRDELSNVTDRASEAVTAIDGMNGLDMSGIIGQLGGVLGALGNVVTQAVAAARAVADIPGTGGVYGEVGARGDPRDFVPTSDLAPGTSPRPQRPGVDSFPGAAPVRPAAGGGGGGAATAEVDAYREAIEGARLEVRELEAEAAALVVLATTGRDVGDALDYARKRAELLKAAQEGGKTITPELAAEIDALAESYARAGVAAGQAADDLRKVENSAEAGADKIAGIFGSILDGSLSAKDAIAALLTQMAQVQILAGFKGLASTGGGGGVFSAIGSALGFARGGYTGNVPEDEVAGVVHGREGVLNAGAMRLPGARSMMESMNAGRMPAAASGPPSKVESTVRIVGGDLMLTDGGAIMARVQAVTDSKIGASNAQRDQAFVGKVNATQANTHRRQR